MANFRSQFYILITSATIFDRSRCLSKLLLIIFYIILLILLLVPRQPFTRRASYTKKYILQPARYLQGVSFARKYEIRSGEKNATQDVYCCSLFATADGKRRRNEYQYFEYYILS